MNHSTTPYCLYTRLVQPIAPPSTHNATGTLSDSDPYGAMLFVIATVCVYGLGIVFFIAGHIQKRTVNRDEEKQISGYLKRLSVQIPSGGEDRRYRVLRLKSTLLAGSALGQRHDQRACLMTGQGQRQRPLRRQPGDIGVVGVGRGRRVVADAGGRRRSRSQSRERCGGVGRECVGVSEGVADGCVSAGDQNVGDTKSDGGGIIGGEGGVGAVGKKRPGAECVHDNDDMSRDNGNAIINNVGSTTHDDDDNGIDIMTSGTMIDRDTRDSGFVVVQRDSVNNIKHGTTHS